MLFDIRYAIKKDKIVAINIEITIFVFKSSNSEAKESLSSSIIKIPKAMSLLIKGVKTKFSFF